VFGKSKEFGSIVNFQYPRMTEEIVNTALELYGSGGKSSAAIVDLYITAVKKLKIKVDEMLPTLPDPTAWATLINDEKAKEAFILAFKDAADQLSMVMQYYEFDWDDSAFGIDEHTWMQYVGAYKNLTYKPGTPLPPTIINPLVGKTKLAGTQVIDAAHILSLIGSKVASSGGIQMVDDETLRIIHEQIQELSNMGEDEQAVLLKEFVDTELVPGNLPRSMSFDESFEAWKKDRRQSIVNAFAQEWGIEAVMLSRTVESYNDSKPDAVPYIDEIVNHVDFDKAINKSAGSRLRHVIALTKELPAWIAEIKQKYS